MTDKTREAIKAEVIKIINRNPADSFDMDGCVNRITSLITAQADGVTDEAVRAEAARRYQVKGKSHWDDVVATERFNAFMDCAKWLRSKLAQPKPDGLYVKCPECGGDGHIIDVEPEFDPPDYIMISCKNCLGRGYIPLPTPPKTTE